VIVLRSLSYWPFYFSLFFLGIIYWGYRYSKKSLLQFWNIPSQQYFEKKQIAWKNLWFFTLLSALILLSITTALLRPSGNPQLQKMERKGRDVVILLDVSRSMDAADLFPSRLERAKWEISEAMNAMEGDRVALVVFAGNSVLKCPLTTDHGFFKMALDQIDTSSVALGGTQMGDAIRDVMKNLLNESTGKYKDILLITDGEDHDSFPLEAAKAAGEAGIRMLIIGLGSDDGEPVPLKDGGYLEYKGEKVRSRLDSDTLRQMASVTPGGKYLKVGTDSFDLSAIYQNLISSAEKDQGSDESRYIYDEWYHWFLIPAILAFLGLLWLELKRKGAVL